MKTLYIFLYSFIASLVITLISTICIDNDYVLIWPLSFTLSFIALIYQRVKINITDIKHPYLCLLLAFTFITLSPYFALMGGLFGGMLGSGLLSYFPESIVSIYEDQLLILFMLMGVSYTGMTILLFASKPLLKKELSIKAINLVTVISILIPIPLIFVVDFEPLVSSFTTPSKPTDITALATFAFTWQFIALFSFGFLTHIKSSTKDGIAI